MIEKWIKIEEIEYSKDTLSEIYEGIDDFDATQNLEKLVEDNFLIQELKNYSIPYKCKWLERLVQSNAKFQSKKINYYIEILIPENYQVQYNNMLKEIKNLEEDSVNNKEWENIESYNKVYKNINKIGNLISKGIFVILIVVVIYMIWQGITK